MQQGGVGDRVGEIQTGVANAQKVSNVMVGNSKSEMGGAREWVRHVITEPDDAPDYRTRPLHLPRN